MIKISRRAVLRGIAVTAAGVALTSGSAVAASAAVPSGAVRAVCTMRTLPVPADSYRSDVAAIDPSGRFVAGLARIDQEVDNDLLMLWDHGRQTSFDLTATDAFPVDVNRHGVVVGNGSSTTSPWRYHDGTLTRLPVIDPADRTFVQAINSRGDILGYGWSADPMLGGYPLLWPADRPGTVEVINTPAGSDVTGLTDDGTIVGYTGYHEPNPAWLRTPAGVLRPLVGPDATQRASARTASGHWAVGQGKQDGALVGVRWDLRTLRPTVLDPRLGFNPDDVNAQGTVLAGNRLQRGNTVVTLPSPAPNQSAAGRALADNGTVAGFHHNGEWTQAVIWTGC